MSICWIDPGWAITCIKPSKETARSTLMRLLLRGGRGSRAVRRPRLAQARLRLWVRKETAHSSEETNGIRQCPVP
jgi:hypothetical protein